MKKLLCISLAACIAFFTACAAEAPGDYATEDYWSGSKSDVMYDNGMDMSAPEIEEYYPEVPMDGNTATVIAQQKKIIKNAGLDIEALDVKECYAAFLAYVESKGGYEFSKNLSGNSDYSNLRATIKVPPQSLDDVLAYAEECGEVINVRTTTDDITADYTDTQIRLDTKKKALERYYKLLEDAHNVDEIIQLQMTIDNMTMEIESYEGRLRLWNSQVNESTIELYIQQADDPDKIPEDVDWNSLSIKSMGRLMKNGFKGAVNVIVSVFQWLLIFVVTISPVLILGGIITVIIVAGVKSKKKKKALQSVENKQE